MSDEDFEKEMDSFDTQDAGGDPNGSLSSSEETLDELPSDGALSAEDAPDELSLDNDEELEEGEGDELTEVDELENQQTEGEENEGDADSETEGDADVDPAEMEELYKPFMASGKEHSVKTVDEARKLMSMGVAFAQNMRGMKPHRKTIKTLSEHKIDDNRLNLLIDASNGSKDAINALIQEHSIDTEALSEMEDNNYIPSDNSVSDSQVEMDDVIERIQSSSSFSTTSDIVSNRWDNASKKVIFDNPANLELLNTHVSNGTYDRVMKEVDNARMFGGLQGLSDLEAYQQVGQKLYAEEQAKTIPTKVSRRPNGKAPVQTDKKLRASPSKGSPRAPAPTVINWAGMSDEELEKHLTN